MEFSYQKPTSARPPSVNTDEETSPSRDISTLQSWIKDKLDTIPSRYSEYDEGMQIIKDAIQQEFAPRHQGIVMLALSKEFYTMGVSTTDTGAEIWSRWRYKPQNQIPEESSATENNLSKGSLAAQEKSKDENSEINAEGVSQVLPNSDTNYWGDLVTPARPQTHTRAKVIYIRSKSPKSPKSGDEGPRDSRLNEHKGVSKSLLINGSESLRTSSVDNFHREGNSFEDNSTLMRPYGDVGSIMATKNYETKPTSAGFKKIMTSSKDTSSLGATQPDSNGSSLGPFLPSDTTILRGFGSSPGDVDPASGYEASPQRPGIHKYSINKKRSEIYYSRLPDIPVDTANNGANSKNADVQRGYHASSNLPEFETYSSNTHHEKYTENNWPIQEVRDEYGNLAGNSMESPNSHLPDTSNRRSKREASPSSVYSFNSNSPHNDPDTSNNMQFKGTLPKAHPEYDPGNPYDSASHTYQPEKGTVRPKQPKDFNDSLAWQNKHIGEGRKSFQTRQSLHGENSYKFKSRSETGEVPADQGATTKFSNPTQPSFTVTKEVTQEEEIDVLGNFNRPTFAAHIPSFGKDSADEIQKIHAKGDSRPAFLKSFRGAVHDGINMTWKGPTKPQQYNSKPSSKFRTRPIEKNSISGPMHDGNPLQLSGSRSTSDILNTARPIPGAGQIYSSPFQSIGESSNVSLLQRPAGEDVTDSGRLPWEYDASAEDPNGNDNTNQVRLYDPESKLGKAMLDPENPTISIGPFQQAALYSWVECSVVQACSDFLCKQQTSLRVSLLKKEVKRWRRNEVKLTDGTKKRDRPVGFMFGMEVQCRLLEGNYKTLVFSGPSKMNPLPTITSWKQMIPSFSPRSFCIPDYVILEHLRMAERILCLFGPGYWDKTLFEKKRSDAVECIMNAGKTQAERDAEEKIAKLRRKRVEAEEELLAEVGMLSTERTSFDGDGI